MQVSIYIFAYLLRGMLWIHQGGSNVSVALANNGRMCTTTHSVHLPLGVVVVDNMEKPPSAPWQPLNQSPPEMVERHCHLHDCITRVRITCAKQQRLHAWHDHPTSVIIKY